MRVGVRAENPAERVAMAAGLAPEAFFEVYGALMMARTVMAGLQLGVFDALAAQELDAPGLAERLGHDERGLDVLLVALHAQGYLERRDGRYRPSVRTKRTLLRDAKRPVREWMGFSYDMWEAFSGLEEAIRTGEPQGLHDKDPDDPYWERYMRGLFELSQLGGGDVARAIGAKKPRRLLDLAGGHGGFAMALCDRHPELQATILELEGAARIGRRIVQEQGYAERISFSVGDLFEAELGTGFDVVTAHNILHHFPPAENVDLLRRARGALAPGGTVAALELERPEGDDRGSQLGALTGVLFYVTSRARTYGAGELEGFFMEAGFERVRSKHLLRVPGCVLTRGEAPA